MLKNNLSPIVRVVIGCLADMSERDKTILIERFKNNKSLQATGKIFNLSNERVKQIEDEIIREIEFDYKNLNN